MESFLEGKTIFVTGATGFLAKILVEKILRLQPNMRKLFLLIRATDTKFAKKRFNDEVMQCELFSVLRGKIGANNLNSLIEEKVFPVAGDISFEDFGIKSSEMKDEMFKEIDIIINSAATTRFDERYDIAMNINVLGASNILKFAKRCANVKILVHVSTAYVCGEREGVIAEKSFNFDDSYIDIDVERKVINDKLQELEAQNLRSKEVTMAMRDLGIKSNIPCEIPQVGSGEGRMYADLVIIRPTIITSTYKEPFPGWIEGVKTLDASILIYGKGISNIFLADPNTNADLIPGDMVVNSILAVIVAHENNKSSQNHFIYHISSSKINPLKVCDVKLCVFHYFTKNPWVGKDGNIIKVKEITLFSSMDSLRAHISRYYWPLLKVLQLANVLTWYYLIDGIYTNLKRKIDKALRLSDSTSLT